MKTTRILRKTGKWIGFSIFGLILLFLILSAYAYLHTIKRQNTVYLKEFISIKIPDDSASIARGRHLYTVHDCKECHGVDLKGKTILEKPLMGRIVAPNLTNGNGGRTSDFNDQDWLRALKFGIDKKGQTLIAMPSDDFTHMPDQDIADIIAYCKNVQPVDNELQETRLGSLLRILTAFDQVNPFPAEQIDPDITYIEKPEEAATAEFGSTLAISCTVCHRDNLQGGPPLVPGYPPVPNISSKGNPGKWTKEQFAQTLKTGVTPEGKVLDNAKMPWQRFREFSDIEISALREYLLSFPKN